MFSQDLSADLVEDDPLALKSYLPHLAARITEQFRKVDAPVETHYWTACYMPAFDVQEDDGQTFTVPARYRVVVVGGIR